MSVVAVLAKAEHEVTVCEVWWRSSQQGYASCSCGWSRQDVNLNLTRASACRHLADRVQPFGQEPETRRGRAR
ncbi:hypothetical protein [Nocardioides humi]|uniref:SWIM-type domain-containing protein n=1 Tax=Nocardioides humi TaxID=449461 RepID=A0ABN2BML5_9ACTN|nr:hypothetical protein [Nocardioides humi]